MAIIAVTGMVPVMDTDEDIARELKLATQPGQEIRTAMFITITKVTE